MAQRSPRSTEAPRDMITASSPTSRMSDPASHPREKMPTNDEEKIMTNHNPIERGDDEHRDDDHPPSKFEWRPGDVVLDSPDDEVEDDVNDGDGDGDDLDDEDESTGS